MYLGIESKEKLRGNNEKMIDKMHSERNPFCQLKLYYNAENEMYIYSTKFEIFIFLYNLIYTFSTRKHYPNRIEMYFTQNLHI